MTDSRSRLDASNVPEMFQSDDGSGGAALFAYAAKVANALRNGGVADDRAQLAGRRLTRAVFHLRSADVGAQMVQVATGDPDDVRYESVHRAIAETDQFIVEAGAAMTITSVFSGLDLCAAAIERLYGSRALEEQWEAKVNRVPNLELLPGDMRDWLEGLRGDAKYRFLRKHRNVIAHGDFLRVEHMQFGSRTRYRPYAVLIDGERHPIDVLVDEAMELGVQHCVALCNALYSRLGEAA